MEPKDPIVWRVIGANVVAWIGAGINAALAPEFGGDAYTAIVAAQNAMVGAFTGALFGGGFGWLTDRAVGNNRRRRFHRNTSATTHREAPRREQSHNLEQIRDLEQIHQQRIRERREIDQE